MGEKHRGHRHWWWFGGIGLCVVLAGSAYALLHPHAPHVATAKVERQSLQSKIFATGSVKPLERQIVMPTQLAAPIESVNVHVNQTVQAGDVLLTLQNTAQKAARDAAQTAVSQAADALVQAKHEQAAAPIGMQPQFAGTIASAQSGLSQAQSNLAQAEAAYDATFIKSKLSGTVILLNPEGVAPDGTAAPILEVVGTGKQIVTTVSEVDAVQIREGMQATLSSDAYPNQTWTAKVSRVADFASTGSSGTGQVEVDLQPIDSFDVPYGYDLNVHITTATHSATAVIPYAALTQGDTSAYSVFVLQGNHVRRTTVSLGITTDTEVEVTKGLSRGETVIVDPPSSLRDGEVVKTS